jgi:hypothetical protein
MKCAQCRHWRMTGTTVAPQRLMHDQGVKIIPPGARGECHANPPHADHIWPVTHEAEHCGKFAARTNFDTARAAEPGAAYSPTSPSTAEAARAVSSRGRQKDGEGKRGREGDAKP